MTDNDSAGVTVSPRSVTVAEGGEGSYTVVLTSEPTASVTVSVSGATGDVTVSGNCQTVWATARCRRMRTVSVMTVVLTSRDADSDADTATLGDEATVTVS